MAKKVVPVDTEKPSKYSHIRTWLPIVVLVVGLTFSFVHGWYFDHSKPFAGAGMADQTTYREASDSLTRGHFPKPGQLHFTIGYPLLGVLGHLVSYHDPFMLVSFGLLVGSALFCFFAVRHMYGSIWALLFSLLLFYWDGVGRVFHFSSDLFALPWNNQVLFFTMAYYLWLFVTKLHKPPSWRLLITSAVISGVCFLTREETLLFVVPIMAAYLFLAKVDWRKAAVCFLIIGACYIPELLVKLAVFGSPFNSGRSIGYGGVRNEYLNPHLLHRNIWETLLDSKHYHPSRDPKRKALLQVIPWLWVSPVGIALALFLKRFSIGLKVFMVASCVIMVFYLSGANMSAQKLRYDCLRYMSSGFIALNLGVIILLHETVAGGVSVIKRTGRLKHEHEAQSHK